MTLRPLQLLPLSIAALASASVHAHDGHGLFGPHWHATDTLGFLGLAVLVAAAIWLSRK